jgi:hypothetical protein
LRLAVEAVVVEIADDAHDLARTFRELRAETFTNEDLLTDGVAFGPVVFCEGLVDEYDEG